MMNEEDIFIQKQKEFLSFLKTRYNLFHLSNLFFRDLHYGVMAFLEMNKMPNRYTPSEGLTRHMIASYEDAGILVRIDDRSWMLNYLPFKKIPSKPPAPAKPSTPTPNPVPASTPVGIKGISPAGSVTRTSGTSGTTSSEGTGPDRMAGTTTRS